jgi:hypothetical protein
MMTNLPYNDEITRFDGSYLKLWTWVDHMLCNKSRQGPINLESELRILTSYWLANGLAEFYSFKQLIHEQSHIITV